ncbi:MAG: ATP-binding protein [Pseudomonadales bacterium]|nr:ATP-binding protein [Pseudomonadales bacterium]
MSLIGVKRSDSIATRAVFSALIAVIVVSIGFSTTQVYLEFQDELKADRLVLARAITASKPALIDATSRLDSVLAQQLTKSLLANEVVDAVTLADDSGAVLASGSKAPFDESMPLVSLLIEKRKSIEAIPLFEDLLDTSAAGPKRYGWLHLEIEPRRGMQDFSERNRQFLWIAILRVLLLVFVLIFILRRQIISPLQQVISDIQNLSALGLTVQKPKGHEQDEIGVLVSEVNASIERQKTQLKQIAENEQRLKSILDGAGDACLLFDLIDGEVVYANQAAFRLLDFSESELLSKRIFDISPSLDVIEWNERVRIITANQSHQREGTLLARDGDQIPVESTSSTINLDGRPLVLSFMRDMRSRKRLETNLAHAQKLTALGELTGGVAHDFNNLLQIIQGALDVIQSAQDAENAENPEVKKSLGIALEASNQGGDLIRQLLAFSRKQILDPMVVDLEIEITRNLTLLQQASGRAISIGFSAKSGQANVKLDANALNNALLNLVVNARHAMPDGGRLSLALSDLTDEDRVQHVPKSLRGQDLVCLSISDTGTGMSLAVSERIFEPFYTTKSETEGTGMGLAMVFGFVVQSGGHIRVSSRIGEGTTFYIYLPTTRDAISDDLLGISGSAKPQPGLSDFSDLPDSTSQALWRNDEMASELDKTKTASAHILLVDDHTDIRFIAKTYLELAGHQVFEAANPTDAIAWLGNVDAAVQLILTDLALPAPDDGLGLIQFCRDTYPDLKLGVISGYVPSLNREGTSLATHQCLSKPFSQEQLHQFVDRLMAG